MIKQLLKTFLRGFVTVFPLLITCYLLVWLLIITENLFQKILLSAFPDRLYFPGLGILVFIALTFVVGILMSAASLRKFFRYFEQELLEIPIIKSIYSGIKDFADFFFGDKQKGFSKAVMVTSSDQHQKFLGFLTETHPEKCLGKEGKGKVGVYLPMSYQLGGYTVFVPKAAVQELDIKIEDAFKYIITAGVAKNNKTN